METQTSQISKNELLEAFEETKEFYSSQSADIEQQRAQLIDIEEQKALYYERLLWAVSNDNSRVILTEINSVKHDLNQVLANLATKQIPFPYEYSKDDLNALKTTRAQIEAIGILINNLHPENLRVKLNEAKAKLKSLRSGESLEPQY